jgi:Protein of unknown function (DUF2934)
VIASESSIRLAPSAQSESLIKDNAPIALADSAVQARAHELYELRGRVDGHAEQDWHQAELDLRAQHSTKLGVNKALR